VCGFVLQACFDESVQGCASAQEFMQELPKFDQDFTKKQEDAEKAGEVSINCFRNA